MRKGERIPLHGHTGHLDGGRIRGSAIAGTSGGGAVPVASTPSGSEPTADAHIADTSDAHDASAISIADSGGYFSGSDVEAALQELGAGGGGGGGVGNMWKMSLASSQTLATSNTLTQILFDRGDI